MRKILKALSLLICAMLLFSACAGIPRQKPGLYRSPMTELFAQQKEITVPARQAEHGEDYVIEWQDPVMERHVRKWLDRPEGDIYHSDVWDYQAVTINAGSGVQDSLIKNAPDGENLGDSFSYDDPLEAYRSRVEGTYEPLTSLADLRHFDSLQVLCVNSKKVSVSLQDLTGLEECKNLVYLTLPSVESSAFPTFAKLDSVVKLFYGRDIVRTDVNVSDLSAFAQMKALEVLWITGSEVDLSQLTGAQLRTLTLDVTRIKSLEPLQQMPQLKALQLVKGPEFPSFEPLDGSSIQYLDLLVSEGAANRYEAMDLTPLARMPQLVWLNLMNHARVDSELCRQILAGDTNLKYLDVSYTKVGKEKVELDTSQLEIFIDAT